MFATWELIVVVLLVLLHGFFAAAEISILTAKRGRLEQQAKAGNRRAGLALRLSGDANTFLSTVQVGMTLVTTLTAAFGGARFSPELATWLRGVAPSYIAPYSENISVGLITIVIGSFSLVFGELVPKRWALQSAESLASVVAYPMIVLRTVVKPMVTVLGGITNLVLAGLRVRMTTNPSVSVEDIEHLIEAGSLAGVLNVSEKEVALEALQLGDRRVKDIMRPRIDIEALDADTPSAEVLGAIAMAGFSRIPVYQDNLDQVIGFVFLKDVVLQQYMNRPLQLRKMLHPPLFVPENLTLDKLLTRFREQRTQLAIVVNEYGGTQGMITMEDVLEELVGEIHDEHRREEQDQQVVVRDDGSWILEGGMPLHDFVELLGDACPNVAMPTEISTISGLLLTQLERVPRIGDKTEWQGVGFEVVSMAGARIERVLVHPPKKTSEG